GHVTLGLAVAIAAVAWTCRRFHGLAAHDDMLLRASVAAVTLRAATWSELAHRLLRRCAAAGSPHSCYLLGMVTSSCYPHDESR
ncbi:unnamed protein product, partial [Urochloa humidicola]